MKTTLLIFLSLILTFTNLQAQSAKRYIKITRTYLNLPVQMSQERQIMKFLINNDTIRVFDIRLSNGDTDYWVFADVSEHIGKEITITYPQKVAGFDKIYQSDEIAGFDSLYKEKNRPRFHFTTRRGWNNDPNGLVYYDGEYHLFYQHNPYEIFWGNMHWGHAISNDLIHWKELPDALYPDKLGTMFSGSAAVDFNNSSGFQSGTEKVIIAAYTADSKAKEVQCIAYSNDRGRTFTKYKDNPVIDSGKKWHTKNTRDPQIFWYKPTKKWIMVLFENNGNSIYTSPDLKNWTYESHVGGFHECPQLFELPVDGDKTNKKWVMYGASGTYMIGDFNGKSFQVEGGKYRYTAGALYAAQTYNDIPESDGRRIQIGWGRITQRNMPFNQMMLFPTELSLRTTREGIRLFSEPIAEITKLHGKEYKWPKLSKDQADKAVKSVDSDLLHVKMKVKVVQGGHFKILLDGNTIVDYDFNFNKFNGNFYGGDRIENLTIPLELLIDRTSVEVFVDHGRFSTSALREVPKAGMRGLGFSGAIDIYDLEIYEMKSVW